MGDSKPTHNGCEPIGCLPVYLEWTKKFRGRTVIFRGLRKDDEEYPKIFRSYEQYQCNFRRQPNNAHDCITLTEYEKSLFDSFKRQAVIRERIETHDDWEWLAWAQHFGLPTRLMDWTKNPLAALYFALNREINDGDQPTVLALITGPLRSGNRQMISLEGDRGSPFEISGPVQRYIPKVTNRRIGAQESVFTIQSRPSTNIWCEIFSVETEQGICSLKADQQVDGVEVLSAAHIDKKKRPTLLSDLHRLGVQKGSLFPDLEGLSNHLRWVWESYRNF